MELFSFILNIGVLQALILIAGLGLMVFEIFNPGFGMPGIVGLILLALGVILTAKSVFEALVMTIILIAILALALALMLRSASKGRLSRTLILSDSLKKESGFSSTEDLSGYLGKEGVAATILRPSGTAEFDGVKLDVVTEGSFIPKGTRIKIINVSGRRVVVREVSECEQQSGCERQKDNLIQV